MILISFKILFVFLLFIGGITSVNTLDLEGTIPKYSNLYVTIAIKFIKNPQIQKFFTEPHNNWEEIEVTPIFNSVLNAYKEKAIISSTRIPSWDLLDEKLRPNQRAIDFSEIVPAEEDVFKFNYFELVTDHSQPVYKPSEPSYSVKDDKFYDLQNFSFDPPYLNFTER